ncbi:hypothetical protein EKO29_02810 [Colwellia sp. Arc7-635]|uniref:lysoplasmalogenase family protein n=1 Tax=Colwellia sp. Arc7-635 TaxID=2497879 RepID=UPI000F85146B|nr:hypothetical protein [Colwellia sp. Arc7-635]AZQ83083.1 hypothetical protein EKO29_02810 [Colwellia sp. Arc7-635]
MPSKVALNRFTKIALYLWIVAVIQSVMAMVGVINITQGNTERIFFGVVELATMVLLIFNAVAIRNFIAKQNCAIASSFSKLCLYALIFCAFGDIVNRNFPQLFYQYDNVIKHSYLADSVVFFFPGYLILVIAIANLAIQQGLSKKLMVTTAAITTAIALITYQDMHLPGTGNLLTLITASYSVLVSILALSALWLIKSLAQYRVPFRLWCAVIGLVLAMVADAVIGKFWIFADHGKGYFPLVSHINWIIYFASQALIQQLPIALLQMKLKPS